MRPRLIVLPRPKATLIGVSALAFVLSVGAASPALAAPSASPESSQLEANIEVPQLTLPEAGAPRARSVQAENDLFGLSTDRLEIETALGYRNTGTVTVTAKRDIRFGNQGEPSVTPEYGAKFTGVCPPYFGTTIMHAGDQCTLEYYFAPQSYYSLAAGWNMRATPVTPAGAPDGDPVDAQVAISGTSKALETASVDAGSVPIGTTSGPIDFRVTNVTAYDLPILAIDPWGSPIRLADPTALPRTLAPGESANIPVAFSPYSAGEQRGSFLVSAHPPVPDWATDRPTSFLATYSGTGVVLPLTATDADFGSATIGAAVERTVTVTNPSGTWLWLTPELHSDAADQDLAVGDFDPALGPGQSVEIPVTWTPKSAHAAGAALGTITFTDSWGAGTPPNSAVSRLTGSTAPVPPPVGPTGPTGPTVPTDPTKPVDPAAPNPPQPGPGTATAVAKPGTGAATGALATTGAQPLWIPIATAAGALLLVGAVLALVARARRRPTDPQD